MLKNQIGFPLLRVLEFLGGRDSLHRHWVEVDLAHCIHNRELPLVVPEVAVLGRVRGARGAQWRFRKAPIFGWVRDAARRGALPSPLRRICSLDLDDVNMRIVDHVGLQGNFGRLFLPWLLGLWPLKGLRSLDRLRRNRRITSATLNRGLICIDLNSLWMRLLVSRMTLFCWFVFVQRGYRHNNGWWA